jgi:hypothetical protein
MTNKISILDIKFNTDEAVKSAVKLRGEISVLQKQQKAYDAQIKQGKVLTEEQAEQYEKNAFSLKELSRELRNTQQQQDALTRANKAAEGSYEQLLQAQKLAEIELKKQADTLKINADGTIEMTQAYFDAKKQVDESKQAILLFNAGIAQGNTNVGNYGNSLEAMRAKLKVLEQQIKTADVGSEKFKEANDEAQALRLSIDQALGKVNEFGEREPKNPVKKAFGDALVTVGLLGSAFETLSGQFSDNEDAQEKLAQAAQATALALTVANIAKEKGAIIDTVSLVSTKAQTAATFLFSKAKAALAATTVGATAATRAFSAALVATGIGALVVGLGLVIANFDKLKAAFDNTTPAIRNLVRVLIPIIPLFEGVAFAANKVGTALGLIKPDKFSVDLDVLNKVLERTNGAFELMNNKLSRTIELRKAQGANEKEIVALTTKQLQIELKQREMVFERAKQIKAALGTLTEEQQKLFDKVEEDYFKAQNRLDVFNAEQITKQRTKSKEAADQRLADQKAVLQRELLQLKEGSDAYLAKQIEILEKEREIQLSQSKLTQAQRLLIEAQTLDQINKLNEEAIKAAKARDIKALTDKISGDEALLRQQYYEQEIADIEAFKQGAFASLDDFNEVRKQKEIKFREEQAAFRIAQLELDILNIENDEALLEAKRAEIAQIKADTLANQLSEENRLKDDALQKEIDRINTLAEVELQRVAIVKNGLAAVQTLFSENEQAQKAFVVFQKALALQEIAINLQRELSVIRAQSSANLLNVPTGGAAGAVELAVRKGLAIAGAAASAASVIKAREGAMFDIMGASHEGGGVPIHVGGQLVAEAEGGEKLAIVKKTASSYLNGLSSINQAFGGRSLTSPTTSQTFANGGLIDTGGLSGAISQSNQLEEAFFRAAKRLPSPVVKVSSINRVNREMKEVRAVSGV